MTNTALVEAILAGEAARFAEVVRRFDRAVRGVVHPAVRDPDGREECVQQTFYLAFSRLHTLASPPRLQAWLVRIARNCVVDYHRRRARRPALPLVNAEGVAERTRPDWIWDEVDTLPAGSAEVIRLRYQDRLSYDEIAQRLGVPLSTVRGRIYLARRALRQRLEEDRTP